MYGLVNRALEDLLRKRCGDAAWESVKRRAGVDVEVFIRMDAYPDDVTYRLVGAAVEETGIPAAELLRAFGEYWTLYTADEGYGGLLDAAGYTLMDVLENLNELHQQVALAYPHLNPPRFECTDRTDRSITLHYYSHRPGLAPMIAGLVEGLGKRFGHQVTTEQVLDRAQGADHDSFNVRIV